ncbi:MAG: glycoside hydrolase 43 family protein [Bacteroidaceae bacterium]|nr:glycoside hydrolase 43 family protein [Bacteroidaceae bacterium]MBQ9176539.1 glycoside hydrolase 43 family protein [Bacteroidaceae bacterium]
MKAKHIMLIALIIMGIMPAHMSAQTTTRMVNPLTYTDIPDNDVIRVGDDFYMVSTTMFLCPGAPIMHSKDLVHWRIVNYIYDYLADDDIYNLRNGKNAHGKGQWATTLRYRDGVYYALFIANDQHKTYVYRTTDIMNGKWERNEIEGAFFHDASLLFDNDGRVYVVYGNGELRITELTPDLRAVKQGGVNQILISTPRQGFGLRAEGAHFYHIGDYYYVIVIDWPSGQPRTERCFRSKTLLGEYESKIILQGAFDGRGDGVAQGAIFDTPRGDWYSVMFQDHGAVGRVPTLQPLTWIDGWPMLGDNGKPVKEFDVKLAPYGEDHVWASDEFTYKSNDDLDLVWQWNHKPINTDWSVTARKGWLRLTTSQLATSIFNARNTLTQRTVGPRCIDETMLDASGMKPGDRAGLCAFMSNYCSIGVEVDDAGQRFIVASSGNLRGSNEELRVPLKGKKAWLRIKYVFTPQADDTCGPDKAFMSYSTDGKKWIDVDYQLQMRFTLDLFIGYKAALYNYPTKQVGGHADFDYFHQWVY